MSASVTPGNAGRNDYPRMVYHPDGRSQVVEDAAKENVLHLQGWGQRPTEAHRARPPTPSPTMSGNDPATLLLRSVLERVLDERGFTKALSQALIAFMAEKEGGVLPGGEMTQAEAAAPLKGRK
jgi:hypothetical protein